MAGRHTGSCATAKEPGCECSCSHAKHGLAGRLAWASALSQQPSSDAVGRIQKEANSRRFDARSELQKRIAKAGEKKQSRGNLKANVIPAMEYARTVDLVDWLVTHALERGQLEKGHQIDVDMNSRVRTRPGKEHERGSPVWTG
jgi:hypothetical protein